MMVQYSRSRLVGLLLILLVVLALTVSVASAKPKNGGKMTVSDITFVDMVTFETGYEYAGTQVGGLSSIIYDAHRGVYYVLSDDRSEEAPSRFYTVDIDVVDGELEVDFVDVTFLRDENGNLFEPFAIDPEGLELPRPGQLIISTEGDDDTDPMTDPFVNRFNPDGEQTRALPVPDKFLYSVEDDNHVRDNLGFESLTATPNRRYLYAAAENALINDGPASTLELGSPARVLEYDLNRKRPLREFIYCVSPIPKPGQFGDNGLVELQALDNMGTFLAMERSWALEPGNTIRLFETSIDGATDVSDITKLELEDCPPPEFGAMDKLFVADFEDDLGVDPDNVEGMALGPMLPGGYQLLIAVSDNNFNDVQTTQFIALAVEISPVD